MTSFRRKINAIILTCVCILLSSCNPYFFDLQTAKMLGAGKLDLTVYTVGVNVGVGLTENIDLNTSLTNDGNLNENIKLNVITIAPKFSLEKDKIAFSMPVSRFSKEKVNMFQPNVLFTKSISKDIDFTVNPKFIVVSNSYAINTLLGISSNLSCHLPKTPLSIRAGIGGVWSQQDLNKQRLFLDANVGLVFNMNY